MGFAKLEHYITNTAEELSKMVKLFASQSINMTFIIFIANLNLSQIDFINYIQDNFPLGRYFFNGLHPDFTRFWYVKVGMAILVLKSINIIWPQILSLVFMVPACVLRRVCCSKKAVFQLEINKYYEGVNINLWDRYASAMSNSFFALTFSPGIPLLLPLQALFLLFQYWIDKILFIKYAKRPPPYGMQLHKKGSKLLPLGLIAHMCCAMFVFTCPQIYPLSVSENVIDTPSTTTTFFD
eukprot:TRINITY_DN13884_c0_g1_i1.p1 TRINITY_DN13884_c0_g1~~TRINITY_DN13884_c0_g1_i1.p1  ORF type:complete len:239 (+),score=23.61 TRINITY_DN13884_c0_g1_i1:235-951(+)